MPRRVLELLTSWGDSLGCGQAKMIWRQVPLYVIWVFGVRGMLGILKI
jgi:hypothetical protein